MPEQDACRDERDHERGGEDDFDGARDGEMDVTARAWASSRQLARAISETARTYFGSSSGAPFTQFLVDRPDRYGRGGDHIAFNERGFAAVRFTEPNENFDRQHQRVETRDGVPLGDVVEKVDFDYVAQNPSNPLQTTLNQASKDILTRVGGPVPTLTPIPTNTVSGTNTATPTKTSIATRTPRPTRTPHR